MNGEIPHHLGGGHSVEGIRRGFVDQEVTELNPEKEIGQR